jgi:uncharacterized protein (TIGR00369 family)
VIVPEHAEVAADQGSEDVEPAGARSAEPRGAEVIRGFLASSPFVGHLGIELQSLERDTAVLRLPFADRVVTIGDVVHGGAIGALIDTAAMAASWSTDEIPEGLRGTTVGLSVDFLSAARGQDVTTTARVLRRGSSLCFCDVEVTGEDGRLVAKALVTYKLG